MSERGVAWAIYAVLTLGGLGLLLTSFGGDAGTTDVVAAGDLPEAGDEQNADDATTTITADPNAPRSFTLAATGDLIVHESVALAAETPGGFDFSPMFASVTPILSSADLAICHLESPLSNDNSDLAYFPAFRVPFQFADAIAGAGYDGCSLASNHSLDSGPEVTSVEPTRRWLTEAGLGVTGTASNPTEAAELRLYLVNGVTVGHLSYTYGLNGIETPLADPYLTNIIDEVAIDEQASNLRTAGAEFIVLSLHWGTEYQHEPNEQQLALGASLLASADVDLVLGHHAHVMQRVEQINGEYLAYGMGNFLSNQSPESCGECPPGTQDGAILQFTVTEGPTGAFSVEQASHIPTFVDRGTYEIVPLDDTPHTSTLSADVLAASAQRTASALTGLPVG